MIRPGSDGTPSGLSATKAFSACIAVSPCVKPTKGLSQQGEAEKKDTSDDDWFETVHGEGFPRDIAQRDAETAIVDDVMEQDQAHEGEEEEQPEVEGVNARRSPKEPTELERLRHESTHVPYRSWCPYCVRGRGRKTAHRHSAGGRGGLWQDTTDQHGLLFHRRGGYARRRAPNACHRG